VRRLITITIIDEKQHTRHYMTMFAHACILSPTNDGRRLVVMGDIRSYCLAVRASAS